jgi:peptidoglycan hydrolase-like protein with peptidoglycan-binding domain
MSDAIQPWPVVRKARHGHPVPAMQYLLRARGHPVTVDGIFGPKTESAVQAFQIAEQLRADGVVGPQTWSALIVEVSAGRTGDAVRAVQEEFLFRSGEPDQGLRVDGIFGPETKSAVRAFQHATGIVSDGIVGPLTWQALVSGMLAL